MKVFDYNRKFPCPTDRHVIPIYNEYKSFMQETLDVWKKGVISQLMMHRGYADLSEARIKLATDKEGFIPIVSLKPVVGIDFDDKVIHYFRFFNQYKETKNLIISEVFSFINTVSEANGSKLNTDKSHLKAMTNAIKVLMASFNNDTYHPDFYEVILNNFNSEDAARAARQMGVSHVVGGDFENGGLLSCEADSDLIGSFYKYVRKIML
jgi:hypothetical protein